MHGQYSSRHPPGLPSDFTEHGLANIFTRCYFERVYESKGALTGVPENKRNLIAHLADGPNDN